MDVNNETEFLSEIINKAIDNDGIKEGHTIIDIFKKIRYYNYQNTHFIGIFDYKNKEIDYKYGFLFINNINYNIQAMGYFKNKGKYLYGTHKITYKIANMYKYINISGYLKYNINNGYYEKNGFVNIKKKLYNDIIINHNEDLFNYNIHSQYINDFEYYKINKCDFCKDNQCNILYFNEQKYVCIQCDRNILLNSNNIIRYFFNNQNNCITMNNRILIEPNNVLYNVDGVFFMKKINSDKLKIKKIEEQSIIKKINYTHINSIIEYILSKTCMEKLNEKNINDFILQHYKEMINIFSL